MKLSPGKRRALLDEGSRFGPISEEEGGKEGNITSHKEEIPYNLRREKGINRLSA